MSSILNNIYKVTKDQYDQLIKNGSVAGHTYDSSAIYLVEEEEKTLTIKSLDTSYATSLTPNANESILGTGTIELHKVSKTGHYSDLIGAPTIPTVYDGTLTLKASDGVTATQKTFTANDSDSVTFEVTHAAPEGAAAGSYGPSAGGTQSAKGTLSITVPQITTDKFGHVTSVSNKTFTVTDTDTTNFMGLYTAAVQNADLDLNNLTTAGSYHINSATNSKNLPTFASGSTLAYGQLLVVRGSSDTIAQLAFPYASSEVAFRTGNPIGNPTGSWKPWKQLATQEWVQEQGYTGAPDLSGYVTKSTDQTITGIKTFSHSTFGAIILKRNGSTNASSITFQNDNGTLGYIGMTDAANGGLKRWPADISTVYTIWDSGNDGSGSGLDADKLDGQEGSYYLNYNNFTNTPTIPTINNGTLIIQKNGTNVATFTANQSGDVTANITVPDPANYYWANVKVSSSSSTATTPVVQKIGITGSTTATANAAVTMEYDSSYKALKFVFA